MCGIFGMLQHHATTPPAAELLRETARRLHHRGPDAGGVYSADGVGLVHARLSLVDLNERSNQPFWDDTGRYALIYNGELYDYAGLRAQLERQGARFHTTSDTEVLLAALLGLGVEATLPQLEGMFAFALYDRQEQTLVAARDRFGIKPLYLYSDESTFVVASTVAAMAPWIPVRANPLMVSSYLQGFNGPTAGHSFYEGVDFVPPGSVIRVRRGGAVQRGRYFQLGDLVDPALSESLARRSEGDVIDEVEQSLLAAVNSQLVADAPVGAFCSGGVDSSLIMAMAARSHGDLQVFHADVEGRLSERSAAERLARHLKLDLRTATVRDHHFVDTLPRVVEHFEYPMVVHPTCVPLLLVSQVVEQNRVKAVLSGEGSDECYGGYRWLAPDIRAALGRLPRRIAGRVRSTIGRGAARGSATRDQSLVRGLASRFEMEVGPDVYGASDAAREDAGASGTFATGAELSYILRTLLHRNDTMGMAASIECRFPFLDSRLVRLAVNLPERYRIRFSPTVFDREHLFYRDKWIIRHIADRYVPRALSQRTKRMFPTNAFERIRIEDAFFEDSFVRDWVGLTHARLRHLLAGVSHSLRLRLWGLDIWGRRCLRGESAAELGDRLARYVTVSPAS
jgi:asparagine synthase (glutamine-hydrolysing)